MKYEGRGVGGGGGGGCQIDQPPSPPGKATFKKPSLTTVKCIYLAQLELKLESSGTHATFLDLDIKIEDGIFVYKLFDMIKETNVHFSLSAWHTLKANIPSTKFCGSTFSEFLRITRCTLKLEHFLPRASELYSRMLSQGANQRCINKQI